MAKSATGKWVSRVGASGGGKAYKKTRPSNYYGVLVIIVVLGLVATILARYDYQHPGKSAASTPPTIGTTWYAALNVEACGKSLPFLNPDPTFKGGFTVQKPNVIRIAPVSAADSGSHATLAQFANEFPGLIASSTELAIPTATGTSNPKTTYRNGQTCPTGTKYAGQTGTISYAYWSFGSTKATVTTNPSSIKFTQFMSVTMAFDPSGVTPQAPRAASVNAMVKDGATAPTTTTVPTTTTSPSTTTLPTGSTTTTVIATTTTTAPKG